MIRLRLVVTLLWVMWLGLGTGPAVAQVELTVVPAMTRGPEGAPVTIVEFLDYE